MSRAWINAIPKNNHFFFANVDLKDCYATIFGQPSKQFARWKGTPFGRNRILDSYGDQLSLQNLPGVPHWDIAHTAIKHCLAKWMRIAEIHVIVEAFGLFSSCFPPGVYETIDTTNRQALVPDIMMDGRICELKRMNASFSHYTLNNSRTPQAPVKRRQERVKGEYMQKAKQADLKYNNHNANTDGKGPIASRLDELGDINSLITGAFYECSPNFHTTLTHIASTFAEKKWESMGFDSLEACQGVYSRVLYRDIGITIARQATWTKRDRLGLVCDGGTSLNQRLATVERERVQIIAQEEQYAQRFSHMHNIVI